MDQQEDIRNLFSLYSESVFRYAVHILDDVNDAEDALQEVFIRVANNRDKYRGDSSIKTWIMAIAKNCIVDVMRKNRRVRIVPWSRETDGKADNQFIEDTLDLKCYIAKLTFQQRSVIALHYFDDLPISEIAAVLGITENRTRRILRRALSQLHDMYSGSYSTQSRGL